MFWRRRPSGFPASRSTLRDQQRGTGENGEGERGRLGAITLAALVIRLKLETVDRKVVFEGKRSGAGPRGEGSGQTAKAIVWGVTCYGCASKKRRRSAFSGSGRDKEWDARPSQQCLCSFKAQCQVEGHLATNCTAHQPTRCDRLT